MGDATGGDSFPGSAPTTSGLALVSTGKVGATRSLAVPRPPPHPHSVPKIGEMVGKRLTGRARCWFGVAAEAFGAHQSPGPMGAAPTGWVQGAGHPWHGPPLPASVSPRSPVGGREVWRGGASTVLGCPGGGVPLPWVLRAQGLWVWGGCSPRPCPTSSLPVLWGGGCQGWVPPTDVPKGMSLWGGGEGPRWGHQGCTPQAVSVGGPWGWGWGRCSIAGTSRAPPLPPPLHPPLAPSFTPRTPGGTQGAGGDRRGAVCPPTLTPAPWKRSLLHTPNHLHRGGAGAGTPLSSPSQHPGPIKGCGDPHAPPGTPPNPRTILSYYFFFLGGGCTAPRSLGTTQPRTAALELGGGGRG